MDNEKLISIIGDEPQEDMETPDGFGSTVMIQCGGGSGTTFPCIIVSIPLGGC